ncbi:zf-HC2 domain-containing protein [Paenibacillus flagellatus]|uniref:Putative zinc-finger domain-containing protein n=1 Tax=Paenibacillus flagellatus TaxID=2211139 RepID=A0A2V5K1S0_9BACL|nr:zf-HC2 domain-containing protein [Paenibacillus flagellatus]PYI52572.1 hypothetical protein DLM86_20580 [Paenibacillus flagellatus]
MSKSECDIVKDLLPLYVDDVCSEASGRMIREHLAVCGDCKDEWEHLRSGFAVSPETADSSRSEIEVIKGISALWNRSMAKAFAKGVAITALSAAILVLAYIGLFRWNVTTVSADTIKITDVSKLADGRIAFHVRLTDGYELHEVRFDSDGNGNFYLTPYRPIVKEKPIMEGGLANRYYVLDDFLQHVYREKHGGSGEITALYFGTREDNVLIWKKGMDVPAASEAVEALLREAR